MSDALTDRLTAIVGARHVSADPDVLAGRCVDHTGRYRGKASALVRPGSADEVAAVLAACRDAGAYVTVQGGRTSLVAGTVPEHDDVLLSTERLSELGPIDVVERRVRVGAGATAAAVQKAAVEAGLVFGVDLASRDSATVGGMAATNAGGLRTVRYGNMGEQVLGLDVALPDGSVVQRHSDVRRDNTGYDLAALFIGAEGTLGVITALDLRLHPTPAHRVTAVAGFADLGALLEAARGLRDADGIAALELVDARASALTAEHLGVGAPVDGAWQLLIELAGDVDHTDRLAEALEGADLAGEPAVGVDVAAYAPDAIPLLFGHVGEGNLHLNLVRCTLDGERERQLYAAMMELIANHHGNVSSEHGVGSRKRDYLAMSRTEADIAAMRAVKMAFDPKGYLNPAVLFLREQTQKPLNSGI